MTGRIDFLTDTYCVSPCFIGFSNGSHTIINFVGTVRLGPDLGIYHVLYVLNLCVISFLFPNCCDLILSMEFTFLKIYVIQDHMLKKKIGLGRLVHRVYNISQAQTNHTSVISLNLLYTRLGHPHISVMKLVFLIVRVLFT